MCMYVCVYVYICMYVCVCNVCTTVCQCVRTYTCNYHRQISEYVYLIHPNVTYIRRFGRTGTSHKGNTLDVTIPPH